VFPRDLVAPRQVAGITPGDGDGVTMAGRLRGSRLTGLVDRFRKWDIVLDGDVAGSVANGQTADVLVECGSHSVRVGHRWWASPIRTFTVTDTKTVHFVRRPRPHPMIWIPYGVASLYRSDLFIFLERMPATRSRSQKSTAVS